MNCLGIPVVGLIGLRIRTNWDRGPNPFCSDCNTISFFRFLHRKLDNILGKAKTILSNVVYMRHH